MRSPLLKAAALLAVLIAAPAARGNAPAGRPAPAPSASGVSASVGLAGVRSLMSRFDAPVRATVHAARMVSVLLKPGEPLPRPLLGALPPLTRRPVEGTLSSAFGYRRDPIRRRRGEHHAGIDLDADAGAPVRSAGPGLVVKAGRYYGYGRVVFLDHGGGVTTRYAHLRRIRVKEGAYVPAGALIGAVGASGRATGPHLHFEVRVDGEPVDPVLAVSAELYPGARGWLGELLERLLRRPGAAPHAG